MQGLCQTNYLSKSSILSHAKTSLQDICTNEINYLTKYLITSSPIISLKCEEWIWANQLNTFQIDCHYKVNANNTENKSFKLQ